MTNKDKNKILWIFCHPTIRNSRANAKIFEYFSKRSETITPHDLYELYPSFWIDVPREQDLLRRHDLIVLQHPFYWYNMPPLLKMWLDEVLLFNFAYGPEGKALHGKKLLLVLSTGGAAESYQSQSYNHFPISAFFPPFIQTANLCGMQWETPFVLHDAHHVTPKILNEHISNIEKYIVSYLAEGVE